MENGNGPVNRQQSQLSPPQMPESLLPANTSLRSIKYDRLSKSPKANVNNDPPPLYPDNPAPLDLKRDAQPVLPAEPQAAAPEQPKKATKPPQEICLECMMRDRDMADVDVSPAVWKRNSDKDVEKALALWSLQEQNGIDTTERAGLKPQDEVTEENLTKWTTINPPVSNYRVTNLKIYVQEQVNRNNVDNSIDKTLDKILKYPSTSSLSSQKTSPPIEERTQQRRRRLSESGAATNTNRTSKQNLAISLANAPPLPTDAANQITNYGQKKVIRSTAARPLTTVTDVPKSSQQLEVPHSPQSTIASPASVHKRPFSLFFKHSNRSAATSVASGLPSGSMVDMHIGLDKDGHNGNNQRANSVNGMEMWHNSSSKSLNEDNKSEKKKKKGIRGLWNRIRGKSASNAHLSNRSVVGSPSFDDRQREGSLLELKQQAEKEDVRSPLPPPPSMRFLSGETDEAPVASPRTRVLLPHQQNNIPNDTPSDRPSFELENSRSTSSNLQKLANKRTTSFLSFGSSGSSVKNIPISP
ncbi:hypothetical protein E3Q09_01174 [Wallemia mellicola]|nr:hypothetical protein E3Q09_01174 [Wallemia mellicola]